MSLLLALTASGSGPQTITGTLFTNTNSFGSGVVVQTSPAQTIVGTLFVNTNSFGAGVVVGGATPEVTSYGSGPFTFPHRQFRIDDEDEREELRKEIVKIGTGTPQEVITGLVQRPNIKRRTPQVETLARLNAERLKAEAARRDRIKRIIAQDDEWLMMA
jgi:hypothetical protein